MLDRYTTGPRKQQDVCLIVSIPRSSCQVRLLVHMIGDPLSQSLGHKGEGNIRSFTLADDDRHNRGCNGVDKAACRC